MKRLYMILLLLFIFFAAVSAKREAPGTDEKISITLSIPLE